MHYGVTLPVGKPTDSLLHNAGDIQFAATEAVQGNREMV